MSLQETCGLQTSKTGFEMEKFQRNEVAADRGDKLISGLISLLMRNAAKNTRPPSAIIQPRNVFVMWSECNLASQSLPTRAGGPLVKKSTFHNVERS